MTNRVAQLTKEQEEFLTTMGVKEYLNEHSYFQTMYELQRRFDEALNEKRGITFSNEQYSLKNVFAVYSEIGEFLDEIGWPWWKEKKTSVEGLLNEIRDLHHFNLKHMILNHVTVEEIIESLEKEYDEEGGLFYRSLKRDENETIDEYFDKVTEAFLNLTKLEDMPYHRYLSLEESLAITLVESFGETTRSLIGSALSEGEDSQYQHDVIFNLAVNTITLLAIQRHYGLDMKGVFESYVEKNIENHNRQKGKSKDATRVGYNKEAESEKTTVVKDGENFVVSNPDGTKTTITKETLFEMNRL